MIEIFAYLLVGSIGIVFAFKPTLVAVTSQFQCLWFIVYAILVVIVRSEFDVDINTYARAMEDISFSLYYIREPVVWIGQSLFFRLVGSSYLVFLFYDLIAAMFLFSALVNLNVPKYSFFGILLFFPFFLGMQNIYRQWFASVLFLYCFSLAWDGDGNGKAKGVFFASALSHNVSFLFMPVLFLKFDWYRVSFRRYFLLLFPLVGIYLGRGTKSSASTGVELEFWYLVVIVLLFLFVFLSDKCIIKKARRTEYELFIVLFFIALCAYFLLSSTGAERVAMFCLIILYPLLAKILDERFSQKFLLRLLYLWCGFFPIFLFGLGNVFLY